MSKACMTFTVRKHFTLYAGVAEWPSLALKRSSELIELDL